MRKFQKDVVSFYACAVLSVCGLALCVVGAPVVGGVALVGAGAVAVLSV